MAARHDLKLCKNNSNACKEKETLTGNTKILSMLGWNGNIDNIIKKLRKWKDIFFSLRKNTNKHQFQAIFTDPKHVGGMPCIHEERLYTNLINKLLLSDLKVKMCIYLTVKWRTFQSCSLRLCMFMIVKALFVDVETQLGRCNWDYHWKSVTLQLPLMTVLWSFGLLLSDQGRVI